MELNLFRELYFSYKQDDHPFLDMYHLNRHSTHTKEYSELRGFIYSLSGRHSHPSSCCQKGGRK
jgi:hypothetical protein